MVTPISRTIIHSQVTQSIVPFMTEALTTYSNDNQPTKEASAARKRLLDSFADYDALSKRIRTLPCPPGSPQDRVQLAILTRANLFLQKNMFPLQVWNSGHLFPSNPTHGYPNSETF